MIPGERKNSIDALEHLNVVFQAFLLIFYMFNSLFYKNAALQSAGFFSSILTTQRWHE